MAHLIDNLGGNGAVAQALNISRSAVANWRMAGRSIPWKFRPAIARMAAERAIPLPADYWGEIASQDNAA